MMIHPEIYAALARERTSTLLAEAEAGQRRARPGHTGPAWATGQRHRAGRCGCATGRRC